MVAASGQPKLWELTPPEAREKARRNVPVICPVASVRLSVTVDVERGYARLYDSDKAVLMALRVTTVYRREGEDWKMMHRHADNLVPTPRHAKRG